jgi:oxygen-independent coproporphyrinogen-3 oxidase
MAAGYTQVSMRFFRAAQAPTADGPVYCCQDDGMVGLGCGARSYTRTHHYSNEYAVGARGVRAILADYITQPDAAFAVADYGVTIDDEDQRRRYVLKSLLRADGLSLADYRTRFGGDVFDDLAELTDLIEHGLATLTDGLLQPTSAGLERSDTIGSWLVSARVRDLMAEYEPR